MIDTTVTMPDSIHAFTDTTANGSVETSDSLATVTTIEASPNRSNSVEPPAGHGNLIAWFSIGLSVCIGVLAWKIIGILRKNVNKLRDRCKSLESNMGMLLSRMEAISKDSNALKQKVVNIPYDAQTQIVDSCKHTEKHKKDELPQRKKQNKKSSLVRFASLQSPDKNGVLRFAKRTMSESSSTGKMFRLEIDPSTGTGIYQLNPNAMSIIAGDLQTFKDFVKPFTFSGNPMNAEIKDKEVGKIVEQGEFWVVEERLEITIK